MESRVHLGCRRSGGFQGAPPSFSSGMGLLLPVKDLAILQCCLVGTAVEHTRTRAHTHAHTHSSEDVPLLCFAKSSWRLNPVLWPDSAPAQLLESRAWCHCGGDSAQPGSLHFQRVSPPPAPGSDPPYGRTSLSLPRDFLCLLAFTSSSGGRGCGGGVFHGGLCRGSRVLTTGLTGDSITILF